MRLAKESARGLSAKIDRAIPVPHAGDLATETANGRETANGTDPRAKGTGHDRRGTASARHRETAREASGICIAKSNC